MKNVHIIMLLAGLASMAPASTLHAQCVASDSVIKAYTPDAHQMALRYVYRNNLPAKDSVHILQPYANQLLYALIAVYNAQGIPQRDTVVEYHKVHTLPDYATNYFSLYADSGAYWMQELRKGNLITGHPVLDSVIARYKVELDRYYAYPWGRHSAVMKTPDSWNIGAVTRDLDTMQGMVEVEHGGYIGDGHNIRDSIDTTPFPAQIYLTYEVGWGDCPAGCINRRFFKFRIGEDCMVEFIGSWGAAMGTTSTNNLMPLGSKVYPNPVQDQLSISSPVYPVLFQLMDAQGTQRMAGVVQEQYQDIHVESLPPGLYFLQLRAGNKNKVHRILKN